jgi:hypothetical protein
LLERSETQRCRMSPTYVPGRRIHRVDRDLAGRWPSCRPVCGLQFFEKIRCRPIMIPLLRNPSGDPGYALDRGAISATVPTNTSIHSPNSGAGASPRSFDGGSPSIPSFNSSISNSCIASPAIWSENSASSSKSSFHLALENLCELNRKAGRPSPRTTPAHPIFPCMSAHRTAVVMRPLRNLEDSCGGLEFTGGPSSAMTSDRNRGSMALYISSYNNPSRSPALNTVSNLNGRIEGTSISERIPSREIHSGVAVVRRG